MSERNKNNPLALLDNDGLRVLASDIRADILSACLNNGGHLSSNLGAVELTIALLRKFEYQDNDILFDVGHQSYAYKILTGRDISTIRKTNGIAPFNDRFESEYDRYSNGHAGDCLGTAIGIATSKLLKGDDSYTIAVIGDASSENGLSYEAMDYLSNHSELKNLIVVINDNGMAISKNQGHLSKKFSHLRNSRMYFRISSKLGSSMAKHKSTWKTFLWLRSVKDHLKRMVISPTFYESLGLKYMGPFDGHDFQDLDLAFEKAKVSSAKGPVVLHILTKKGYGYAAAAGDESGDYHGVSKHFDETIPSKMDSFTDLKQQLLEEKMEQYPNLCVITPAMEKGSGLERIFSLHPDRCFDVGIAEENAVLLASGLSLKGNFPVIDIYSTFLQRCYDEILENIARQKVPCVFIVERAGLVGEDGSSHQGLYDVALVKNIPGRHVYMPFNEESLAYCKDRPFRQDGITFIRFPKGAPVITEEKISIENGYSWVHKENNNRRLVISVSVNGYLLNQKLPSDFDSLVLVDLLPSDEVLNSLGLNGYDSIYFYDSYSTKEGTDSYLADYLLRHHYQGKYENYSFKNDFVRFGQIPDLLKENELDVETVFAKITKKDTL